MEDYEKRFVEKCDLYILEASKQSEFDEEFLILINGNISLIKTAITIFDKQKQKQFNKLRYQYLSQRNIFSFLAYVNFFQIDIFTSLKYLCITKNILEKRFFIKQSYASIYEFLTRITNSSSDQLSKEIELTSLEAFKSFIIMKNEMENFSKTANYKLMEDVRNKISNHYDQDAILYISLMKKLEELEAVSEIAKVFQLLKYCKDFNDLLMPILADKIEFNYQILKKINA